jgi:hypothetical protein
MQQAICNYDGTVFYFDPLPGSDVWPYPLFPTTPPFGTRDNLPECIKKYELRLRLGLTAHSVRGKLGGCRLRGFYDWA